MEPLFHRQLSKNVFLFSPFYILPWHETDNIPAPLFLSFCLKPRETNFGNKDSKNRCLFQKLKNLEGVKIQKEPCCLVLNEY